MKDSTLSERKSILRFRTVLTLLEEEYDTDDPVKAKELHKDAMVSLSLWSMSTAEVILQEKVSTWFEQENRSIEASMKRISGLLKEKE